jgi:hypothetical protein
MHRERVKRELDVIDLERVKRELVDGRLDFIVWERRIEGGGGYLAGLNASRAAYRGSWWIEGWTGSRVDQRWLERAEWMSRTSWSFMDRERARSIWWIEGWTFLFIESGSKMAGSGG